MPTRSRKDAPRNRRKLSPALDNAITAEARRLEDIADPVATIKAVADTFVALDARAEDLALVRLKAVAVLRADGWSYGRIAEETGLSRSRVQQLSNEATARKL